MKVQGMGLGLLFLLAASTCVAQSSQDTSNSPANGAKPATSAPDSSNSTGEKKKPKKVWTNDDVPSAKPGATDKRGATSRATPSQTVDSATVQRIRKSLEKLEGQLDDVKKKLKSYREFQEGEPVSTADREINKGVNRVPVDQQIVQLQEKKKQLEAQISDLYDEARKKGLDPGMLR